jgi:hypothetical protein
LRISATRRAETPAQGVGVGAARDVEDRLAVGLLAADGLLGQRPEEQEVLLGEQAFAGAVAQAAGVVEQPRVERRLLRQ